MLPPTKRGGTGLATERVYKNLANLRPPRTAAAEFPSVVLLLYVVLSYFARLAVKKSTPNLSLLYCWAFIHAYYFLGIRSDDVPSYPWDEMAFAQNLVLCPDIVAAVHTCLTLPWHYWTKRTYITIPGDHC